MKTITTLLGILLAVFLIMYCTGCVNPKSKVTEITYKSGEVQKIKITEKVQPHAVKQICFGLKIGFELETKIPIVYFGIIKREYIVGDNKFMPFIDENYYDINLLLGQGWVTSYMGINDIDN